MNHPPRRSTSTDRPPLQSKRLLDQLRERIRYLHYSLKTEEAYLSWSRAYIRFHGVRHPKDMGAAEVEAFLTHLTNVRRVSVSTHKQALSALPEAAAAASESAALPAAPTPPSPN